MQYTCRPFAIKRAEGGFMCAAVTYFVDSRSFTMGPRSSNLKFRIDKYRNIFQQFESIRGNVWPSSIKTGSGWSCWCRKTAYVNNKAVTVQRVHDRCFVFRKFPVFEQTARDGVDTTTCLKQCQKSLT